MAAPRVIWFALKTLYTDMFVLVGGSLIWFLLNLPTFAVATGVALGLNSAMQAAFGVDLGEALLIVLFLGLTALAPTPASVALTHLTARLAREDLFEMALVWAGLRRDWRRATVLWLIAVVIFTVLLANLIFYTQSDQQLARLLSVLFGWLILLWFAVQLLLTPLLVEQPARPLLLILRNALVITLAHPLLLFVLLFVALVAIALAFVLPVLTPLLLGAFLTLLGARALAVITWRYYPEEAPRPADELEEA